MDIINCSWTTPAVNDNLRNAINEVGGSALVFCAGYDEPYYSDETYPASYPTAISVAAATARGRRRVEAPSQVDLLVLGEDIEVTGPQYLRTSAKVASGSSVATAFASGLASMLLVYCRIYDQETGMWKQYRRKEVMLQLFKLMQPGWSRNLNYVDPGFLFRNKFTRDGRPTDNVSQCFRGVQQLQTWLQR